MKSAVTTCTFGCDVISDENKMMYNNYMERKIVTRRHVLWPFYIWGLVLLSVCTGCGSGHGELFPPPDEPLIWPEPPEKARIKYIGELSTEADLKKETSWSESLGQLIFGKRDIGVLIGPYAIAVDPDERLFVTDTPAGAVHMFDLGTREYKQFAKLAGEEKLLKPVALVIVDDQIYVVDSVLHKVCVFDKDAKFVYSFGEKRLRRPSGIAYSKADQLIYVSDSAAHLISVFDKKGEFEYNIGSRGLLPGEFNFPTHLWVDGSARLYVSDTLNYRIQVFESGGTFLRTFGLQGDRPGNLAHPCGVATDSFGRIYVVDRQFENVQIFDSDGRILMAFGQEGGGLGQFWLPAGIFIDSRNRIYVADSFNKRVQIFELLGEADQ